MEVMTSAALGLSRHDAATWPKVLQLSLYGLLMCCASCCVSLILVLLHLVSCQERVPILYCGCVYDLQLTWSPSTGWG